MLHNAIRKTHLEKCCHLSPITREFGHVKGFVFSNYSSSLLELPKLHHKELGGDHILALSAPF